MTPVVHLDLTRLARRIGHPAATGIDRWELEVAKRLLCGAAGVPVQPVVQIRGRLRRMPLASRLVDRAAAQWDRGQAPAHGSRLWRQAGRLGQPVTATGIYLNLSHQGLETPQLWNDLVRTTLHPVVYIHDLIPIHHPDTTRPEQPDRHAARLRNALHNRATVLCPARPVADDIRAYARAAGLPAPDPTCLPPGTQARRAPRAAVPATGRASFVCLGTLEPRKAHDLLPAIWAEWTNEQRPDLVVMGQTGWTGDQILARLRAAPSLRDRLRVHLAPTDQDVTTALQQATALLMPSRAEGWGLPVAEALSLGTPVLTRDLPVYTEVAQGLHTPLPDPQIAPDQWHTAMEDLMRTPRRIEGFGHRGWDDALQPLWALLRGLL